MILEPLPRHDIGQADAFLALHSRSSMYLRAELRRDISNFAIARMQGEIAAVAAQVANGMMLLQAPLGAGALAAAVLRLTGQQLAGFFGPMAQVQAALRDMGLAQAPLLKNTHEDLFALPLSELRLPAALVAQTVRCRVAGEADASLLIAWRAAFRRAALNEVDDARIAQASRDDIAALLPAGSLFVLESDRPLACCSFNARLPDMVQIGNVWTPPALRGRGYARSVVAGALALAAQAGVGEAILSTGRDNVAAQAAYRGIGFQLAGDYATVMLACPE